MTTAFNPLARASVPEAMFYRELQRRGLAPGVDFYFQAPFFGEGRERGTRIVDFYFNNPPKLAVNVQGEYWHGRWGGGSETRARDLMTRATLAGYGITLIFADEADIMADVRDVVSAALQYRDVSRLG